MSLTENRLYQAVLRDTRAPISLRLRPAFSQWVVEKGFPPLDAGSPLIEHEVKGARLRIQRRGDSGRYTLEEPVGDGTLLTSVTYTESIRGMTGWVVVSVEQRGGEPVNVNAPGFVPAYLRTARITDGAVHLEDAPVVVDEETVERLMETLTERRRRVPVVVVSIDPRDADAARSRAEYLSAATAGAAVVAVLADKRAQDRFNQLVGIDLEVFGGGVRTYLAPFTPDAERYPNRHRCLGGPTIRKEGNRALEHAIDGVIGEILRRPLPEDVQRTLPVVRRVVAGRTEPREIARVLEAPRTPLEELHRRMMEKTVRPTPAKPAAEAVPEKPAAPPPPSPAEPSASDSPASASSVSPSSPILATGPDPAGLAQIVADIVVKELREDLELALSLAITASASSEGLLDLSNRIDTLAAHVDALREIVVERIAPPEEDLASLRAEYQILMDEYAEVATANRRLTERIRLLNRKLAEAGQPMYGRPVEEELFEPTSLVETINEARRRLTHVDILGTDQAAARLDITYPALARTWAAKAWDALRALDAFARARSSGHFSGGFYDWCSNASPDRLTIPVGMVCMRESQSVTNRAKYADPRTFPVPPEVDPTGKRLMEAHIKLRPVGYPAPRMYFHDDAGGTTGKIWVGYIGDHLPNTRTN